MPAKRMHSRVYGTPRVCEHKQEDREPIEVRNRKCEKFEIYDAGCGMNTSEVFREGSDRLTEHVTQSGQDTASADFITNLAQYFSVRTNRHQLCPYATRTGSQYLSLRAGWHRPTSKVFGAFAPAPVIPVRSTDQIADVGHTFRPAPVMSVRGVIRPDDFFHAYIDRQQPYPYTALNGLQISPYARRSISNTCIHTRYGSHHSISQYARIGISLVRTRH